MEHSLTDADFPSARNAVAGRVARGTRAGGDALR